MLFRSDPDPGSENVTESNQMRPENEAESGAQAVEAATASNAIMEASVKKKSKKKKINNDIPTPASVESETVGEHFIVWVRQGLTDGRLSINNREASVHILPEGVALVSPAIFEAYLRHHDFATESDEIKKQQRRLQGRLEKLRLNIKTKRQLNVHKIAIKNSTSRLHAFLFPHAVFYDDKKSPAVNDVLTLLR